MLFLILLSLTAQLMPVSTECAAALLSFRYPSYTSYLRRKSIMKRCFYHTKLRQNAVFHNFSRQTSLIQYSVPSKQAWAFSETRSNQSNQINQSIFRTIEPRVDF